MKWTEVQEIAIQLSDAHPEVDPTRVNFVDLMNWVIALPEFDDDPKRCGERILEGIQQAWIDEIHLGRSDVGMGVGKLEGDFLNFGPLHVSASLREPC